jgi:opacity protein-like surface antigen
MKGNIRLARNGSPQWTLKGHMTWLILLFVLLAASIGFGQTKEPLSFEGIVRLPDFGLTSRQIADQITESGVTFEVTSAQLDSLRKLGFDDSVINAVRQYYRMGIVKVATTPGQVNVLVDNQPQGTTDLSGIWEGEIPRGVHALKLQKSGFADLDTSVTVIKDRTVSLRLQLQQGVSTAGAGESKFAGRFGAYVGFGLGISSPAFDDKTHWKTGNNISFALKGNILPYALVDLELNLVSYNDFAPGTGEDFGSLDVWNISLIPGLYKEFQEKFRGYLGLGLEFNNSKIENGIFESDGVIYIPDGKDSKGAIALIGKLGGEALVLENIFLFAEYRGHSVLGQYAMSFIAIGVGTYIN